MWSVDQRDFLLLRDGIGQRFTGLVNALIQAHGAVHGLGEADILPCFRTSIQDGGVDLQVRRAMPSEPTGFLQLLTCWQYKARPYAEISDAALQKEMRKPYAAQLIREGYAYRLAICDDMPANKQTRWEELLTTAARKINPQAPEARVVTASQLASWANSYPALLPRFFHRDPGPGQHFDAWARNITNVTPTFVAVEAWRGKTELIQAHIDLTQSVKSPIITLQGAAGVGKTRLVYEIVANLPGVRNLVFYTADGKDAEQVARLLANHGGVRCVLIADECPVLSRDCIMKLLKGHSERVRVVCIDNSGERLGSSEELWLDQLPASAVEQVLEENFAWVPDDRRRAYAAASRGYIRLAAGLCECDAAIQTKGHFGPALDIIQEYYRRSLPEERQQKVVEAVSLVQKVGFGEGITEELEALCAFTGQTRQEVLDMVAALKDAPGFVARTTRYLYVTPDIIAQVAFNRAWHRWFEPDPAAVLRRLPTILLSAFQARVARSGSAEVRALTGQFFWDSVTNLKPADLADVDTAEKLATLINTNPDLYFPRLALLVRTATVEELRQTQGEWDCQGSRRTLVGTAESLAMFPQYFGDAEEILRRLALAEVEKDIGNNATGIWKQLFRIALSGTATPFRERVALLGRLLFAACPDESGLFIQALSETLNFTGSRTLGPTVVGGHIAPSDWYPGNAKEFQDCLERALALFEQVFDKGTPELQQQAWPVLATHMWSLLSQGMLPTVQSMLQKHSIPEAHLPEMLESVEDFLQYECRSESGSMVDGPYCREAFAWLLAITPGDLAGRVRAVIGKDPWHQTIRENRSGIPSEVLSLAQQLSSDPVTFEAVLPYLNSPEARSAGFLGEALGQLDTRGGYLDRILESAAESGSSTLARGYASRLVATDPAHAERLNGWLDRLEKDAPEVAYFIALATPECSRPLERTVRLIREQKISVHALQNFIVGVLLDRMSSDDLRTVLDLLVQAGDLQSLHIAVDFVGHVVRKSRLIGVPERESLWRVLEASAQVEDRSRFWWAQTVETLAPSDSERACAVATLALTGEDHGKRDRAWDILSSLARTQPDLVMNTVGRVLLDEEQGWRLQVGARSGLFQVLPLDIVRRWLDETGIAGARSLANHLQMPSLDSEGKPQLHALTEHILATWGEDDAVFSHFAAATHHMQMYSGDIGSIHRREAERARRFLHHLIPAIRRWAEQEMAFSEEQARQWTIRQEEEFLE